MPALFRIDEALGIVVARATGDVVVSDLIDGFNALVEETGGRALYLPLLFRAHERATHHEMSLQGLESIRDNLIRLHKLYGGRRVKNAFVVADAVKEPFAHMWQALIAAGAGIDMETGVFTTEEAAIKWLRS